MTADQGIHAVRGISDMPFPVAHSLVCTGLVEALLPCRRRIETGSAFIAFRAVLPDLDFLLVGVFDFSRDWHRGLAHAIASVGIPLLDDCTLEQTATQSCCRVHSTVSASHGGNREVHGARSMRPPMSSNSEARDDFHSVPTFIELQLPHQEHQTCG